MGVAVILKKIEALSNNERAVLLGQLAERYPDHNPILELSPEVEQELKQRVADADANPDAGIPWNVVDAESMKRVRK